MTICGVAMRRSRIRSYTALVDCGNKQVRAHSALGLSTIPLHPCLWELTWKVPRPSSKSASMDHTFSDLYTRFCTGSEPSKYSAWRAGKAVARCGKTVAKALRGCPGAYHTSLAGLHILTRSRRKAALYSPWRSSSSPHWHHTLAKSSTCLKFTWVAFSRMVRACGNGQRLAETLPLGHRKPHGEMQYAHRTYIIQLIIVFVKLGECNP